MASSIMLHWQERLDRDLVGRAEEIMNDLEHGVIDEDEAYEELMCNELTCDEAEDAVNQAVSWRDS